MSVRAAMRGGWARRAGGLALGLPLTILWLWPEEGWPAALSAVPRLLPAFALATLSIAFFRTLRPGREPLIARYARFDDAPFTPERAAYARAVTVVWAAALAAAAGIEALAASRGVDPGWGVDLSLLALFLGEHAVRARRFGTPATPAVTFRAILRAERARHG